MKAKIFFLVLITVLMLRNAAHTMQNVVAERPDDRYMDCAKWIRFNSDEGDVVFHPSWDNFPELVYYNDHNYYLYGLAPDFLYVYNTTRYELWENIRKGFVKDPGNIIKEKFGAEIVFVDNRYRMFEKRLNNDDSVRLAFADDKCRVYLIS